ncbi:HAMP domain-containing sensor histidine kinase [Paenibacillus thermotolerans]|uniref:HAMP domain-containing sensor histidine kinase n=1 Tax=Paenibacillus thermotolerans TaxID=3027807 RepID=UPI0023682EA0|nr:MULTISPECIES: ATP-binding protein [unclassified Paenibacillus]
MLTILKSIVGKLWMTIIVLVAVVLLILGIPLLQYIDTVFSVAEAYEVKRLFIIACAIGFLLTTFFAFFLSTKITQPLLQLKRAADMITAGEYQSRVRIHSDDEIGQLSRAFNHMGEKLDVTIRDLNYEKEHLSSILRSMTDAVITVDADGFVISCNPPGETVAGEWEKLVAPHRAAPAAAVAGDGELPKERPRRSIPAPLYDVFRMVVEEEKEVVTKLHVGSGVWSVSMDPLYTHGTLHGAVAVLRDVTEEYRAEKMRKDFVANVSHELRTPLSMLQGYSEALLDDIASTPEERREMAQVINEESLRMGRLVKDLLDLAKIEAGRLEMNMGNVSLMPLLQRVHRKFSVLAKDQGITLRLDVDPNAAAGLVLESADEDRLEQVMTNLLDNAIRHTPEGKDITVRAERAQLPGGDAVRIEIEDQGQGIPPEDFPYIFERFYKADKARTRGASAGGTGLGLAIVKNIIDAHEGTITAKSRIGHGTTFTVTLPVAAAVSVEKRR